MFDLQENTLPTADELRDCDWASRVATCESRVYWRYASVFFSAADEAKAANRLEAYRAFRFLGHLTSMTLCLDQPAAPFSPRIQGTTFRTASLEDFTDEAQRLLTDVAADIRDVEVRARICDVLWEARRDHVSGRTAVDEYLCSAFILIDDHGEEAAHRLERALQLAMALRDPELVARVVAAIDGTLARYDERDPRYISAELLRTLRDARQGDPSLCLGYADTAASKSEAAGNLEQAATYLALKADWESRTGHPEARISTLQRIGEIWAKEAEQAASAASFGQAVMFAQRALEGLNKVTGTRVRRREIHALLLGYQERALAELKMNSVTVDITRFVRHAQGLVRGRPLRDALIQLALSYQPVERAALKAAVEEQTRDSPLVSRITSVQLSAQGRVAARRGPVTGGTTDDREAALEAEMFSHLKSHQSIKAQGLIEPARAQITYEHQVRVSDLHVLLLESPFVPGGRESLYARGLWHGLHGDYSTALHLLIPQIEHSIRILLYMRANAPTSNLKPDGTQDELDLNTTLRMPELSTIFDADLVFDLRGLLIERFGWNLRNRFAHGLMSAPELLSPGAAYLWWLTLFLCLMPVALPQAEATPDNAEGAAPAVVASTPLEPA